MIIVYRFIGVRFSIHCRNFMYILLFSEHQRLLKMKHRTISVRIFPRKFVNIIKFGTYCEMLPTCSKATSVFMITRVFRMKPIFKELAVTKNIS